MRRNQKPWQEKLDLIALAALDAHKQTRGVLNIPEGDLKDVIRWLQEHRSDIEAAYAKFPRRQNNALPKTVKLDKAFVKFAKSVKHFEEFHLESGENETIQFYGEILENTQKLFHIFEKKRADRALIYFNLALIYAVARPLVEDFRNKQFGPEPLDWEKKRILAAMCLEFVTALLRGRVESPKGRINLELIKYINLLQEHQTEPLTDRDLRDALAHAGFDVPAVEHSWSVFLNRARKKGLVAKPKTN